MKGELEGRDKQAVIRAEETRKGPLARQRHREEEGIASEESSGV